MIKLSAKWLWWVVGIILVFVRTLPEIMIGKLPTGTDSANTYVTGFLHYYRSFLQSLKSFDLYYWILSVERKMGLDAFLGIKITAVILFVLLAILFGLVLKDKLKLPSWLSALGALAYGLQLNSLRMSWDLHRNELSILLALAAIWLFPATKNERSFWLKLVSAALLGILAIFSHQIAGVAFLAFLVISAVIWLASKVTKSQLLLVIVSILAAVVWVYLSQKINYGGMTLWVDNNTGDHGWSMQRHLLQTIYPITLVLLAIGGLLVKRLYSVIAISIVILAYAFSFAVFKDIMIALWDRWTYFLGLPLTVFTMLSINAIISSRPLKGLASGLKGSVVLVLILTFIYPGLVFLNPNKDVLPSRYHDQLSGFIPSNIVGNSLGQYPNSAYLVNNAEVLRKNYIPGTPIFTNWRYKGVADYYLSDLDANISISESGMILPNRYYVWCLNFDQLPLDMMYDGIEGESCPVMSFGVTLAN